MSLTINNESFTITNNGKSFEILKDNASLDRNSERVYMNGFWWDLEKATADGYASLDDLYNTLRDKIDHRYTGGGGGIESIVAGTNITVDNTDPLNPIVSVQDITLSGEVTGSTSLSAIDKTAITNKTTETIVGTDYVLFGDTSDGDNLKKGLVSDIVALSGGGGGGSPAGSDTQIQINQSGAFFADSTFQKSDTDFNVGLDHTQQSAVTFTGSGLDDLTVAGTFTGTVPTTYTVTVASTGTPDTFDWTDGTNSGTGVSMSTSPTLLSNGISITFGADTGHTLTDEWTWTYSYVNQNVLDFSNNDYKFQSTFGTDTFGYQIGDNLFGAGFKSAVNTYTNVAGDIGLSGITNNQQLQIIDQLYFADGNITTQSLLKNQYDIEVDNGTELSSIGITAATFEIKSIISSGEHGISQSAGAVTLGSLVGGNSTKITIDDVTQLVTISNVPTYADDAAAAIGGLTSGMLYKTTTGGITALNIVP
jgi:hypothetical protein